MDEPAGVPDNLEYKEDKVRLGNALADATVVLASAQARKGRCTQFEQPKRSLMLGYSPRPSDDGGIRVRSVSAGRLRRRGALAQTASDQYA